MTQGLIKSLAESAPDKSATFGDLLRFVADLRMQGYDWRQILVLLGFQAAVLGRDLFGHQGVGNRHDRAFGEAHQEACAEQHHEARRQADRVVLRLGKAIDSVPPDYRELDDLFVRAQAAE